jgi:hypothetical protein
MRGTTHNSIGGIVSRPFDKLRAGSCKNARSADPPFRNRKENTEGWATPSTVVVDGMTPLAC